MTHGQYSVAYLVEGAVPLRSAAELLDIVNRATVRHTGWSPWWVPTREGIRPYQKDGAIECNLDEDGSRREADPAHADFWRVTADGRAFLVRGYDEDSLPDRVSPDRFFDITLPVWRIGECVLQACQFTRLLAEEDRDISFLIRWDGLQGRELTSVDKRRQVMQGRKSRQDVLEIGFSAHSANIDDRLPELLYEALRPLYSLFDFFDLPKNLVDVEVQRLRSGRF